MSTFKIVAIGRHRIGIDGKGVTTLVVLSGCPLNCKYCINKELLTKSKVREHSQDWLIQKIMKDYCYYVATGGGVTFGGGEPLLQYKAISEFIDLMQGSIAVNIETSLNVDKQAVKSVLDKVSSLIIDIKDMDNGIYELYTGINNSKLLQNLEFIAKEEQQSKCKIRIPIIKGYNTEENVKISRKILEDMGFSEFDIFEYRVEHE